MHLSTAAKTLLLFFLVVMPLSCSYGPDSGGVPAALPDGERELSIPFLNNEPETYTAVVEISFAGRTEQKFVAKKGTMRRTDHRYLTERQLTAIEAGRSYALDPKRKIYTELEEESGLDEPEFIRDLTAQLLTSREDAEFTKLSDESGLERYQVTLGRDSSSEIIVYVDHNLQMPVKQEFYSVKEGEKKLVYSLVFKEIKLSADDSLFQVPEDHKKVDQAAFFKAVRAVKERN